MGTVVLNQNPVEFKGRSVQLGGIVVRLVNCYSIHFIIIERFVMKVELYRFIEYCT